MSPLATIGSLELAKLTLTNLTGPFECERCPAQSPHVFCPTPKTPIYRFFHAACCVNVSTTRLNARAVLLPRVVRSAVITWFITVRLSGRWHEVRLYGASQNWLKGSSEKISHSCQREGDVGGLCSDKQGDAIWWSCIIYRNQLRRHPPCWSRTHTCTHAHTRAHGWSMLIWCREHNRMDKWGGGWKQKSIFIHFYCLVSHVLWTYSSCQFDCMSRSANPVKGGNGGGLLKQRNKYTKWTLLFMEYSTII